MTIPPIRTVEAERSAPPRPHRAPLRGLVAGALAGALMIVFPAASFARSAPDSFADLAEKVTPAVVNISTEQQLAGPVAGGQQPPLPFPEGSPFGEFFRRFMDQNPGFTLPDQPRTMRALGSGFIIDPEGYVVTNNHVIDGAQKITVTLASGENLDARVVGRDPRTDLALIRVESDDPLPYVELGDSDEIRVGDWVMAVGNPFGLGGTVTAGIVSARGRHLEGDSIVDFLQTDAPINRGNSGGPTFDMDGRVVGVNTAIYSPNGGSVGLGFAIPSNVAKKVVADLREHGTVNRGWLGVQIQPVTPDLAESLGLAKPEGALVASVVPDSPAAKAGLAPGDVILSWNGEEVKTPGELVRLVAGGRANEKVEAVVWRGGDKRTIRVTTGSPPADQRAAAETGPESGAATVAQSLGIGVVDLTPAVRQRFDLPADATGVAVASVERDSPADDQGIRAGDVIESVALQPVTSAADFAAKVEQAARSGKKVITLKITREGNARFVALRTAQA